MPNSTQKYLKISEFRDDLIIMQDGTLRAVMICSSVNFALKGEDEQSALISAYVQFLNSLDHPIQIVIQSRKLDIDNYIRRLRETEKTMQNELLRNQILGYIEYIQQLIEMQEIMTKKFFIVVPFNPLGAKNKSFWQRMKETLFAAQQIKIKKDALAKYKEEIDLRISNIKGNLQGLGVESQVLDTQGLIELFYNVYNPVTGQNQKITDLSQLNLEK
jgi:hypothetical protein